VIRRAVKLHGRFAVNYSCDYLRRQTMKKTFLKLTVLALAGALALAACGNAEAGPAGTPGAPGTNGEPGGVGVMVRDASDQLIGYLVSTNTGATGNYTVYNPSAIGAAYPDGVFTIGKASHTGTLGAWTGSGTDGLATTGSSIFYQTTAGTGDPLQSEGYSGAPTAYYVKGLLWDGSTTQLSPNYTYYTWKTDTNNDGLPDAPSAITSAAIRVPATSSPVSDPQTGTFYDLKIVTASEVDALKSLAYAKFLADTGLDSLANPITWPLHLDAVAE
jgi:hypothetical protein